MSALFQIPARGRLIGYARVSTFDQILDIQLEALNSANCHEIFSDHGVSGAKASRPGLDDALAMLEPGDTIVVFKLDRLGRSVSHLAALLTDLHKRGIEFCSLTEGINTNTPGGKLVFHIFSAVAEFQRDLIRENTRHGMEAARARGKQIGRPRKLDEWQVITAHQRVFEGGMDTATVARNFGVCEATLSRAFARMGLDAL